MNKRDWHGYAERLAAAERAVDKAPISQRNKELIHAFKRQLVVEGLTAARILVYLQKLPRVAKDLGKDFEACTREDLVRFVEGIERRAYSEWTKQGYKVTLKRFWRWLRNSEDEYPPEVKWIKTNIRKDRLALPGEGDLPSLAEIRRVIEAADHPRDKALVAVLYESGCRIGEIGTLRIRDVDFGTHGCHLKVTGKTGSRPVLILESSHYLATWLSMHPQRDNRDAPLWVNVGSTNKGRQMEYPTIRKMLSTLFDKAGVKKRSKPHNFRHARATHLANHLTEFQMNSHFGWTQGSKMPAVYVHLTGKNTDDALLRLHGIRNDDQKEEPQHRARTCPRCEHVNPSTFQFCGKCGGSLDLKAALEKQERMRQLEDRRGESEKVLGLLLEDREVRDLLRSKLALFQR